MLNMKQFWFIAAISGMLCLSASSGQTIAAPKASSQSHAPATSAQSQSDVIDALLIQTLQEIKEGRLNQAMNSVNRLLGVAPNFSLAHLIRGDLLAAKARMVSGFGDAQVRDAGAIQDFREEAETRIRAYLDKRVGDKQTGKLQPNVMMSLSRDQQYVLFVDTAKSRLYTYQKQADGSLKYFSDYYVTIGKNGIGKKDQGDKRTPVGIYFAAKKLATPLPDLYGDGAFPLNYPNEIDKFERKTGSGIWIHGTPHNTYSRPPRASDGCVVLTNDDLNALTPYLQKGNTPVVLGVDFEWVSPDKLYDYHETKQSLKQALEQWRQDWEAQDTDAYLSHYAKDFFYSDGRLAQWSDYKRKIQASKPQVTVRIDDVSMFGYPNAKQTMVVVNFEQTFISPSLQNKMKKRQYWVKEGNAWKIFYEGAG